MLLPLYILLKILKMSRSHEYLCILVLVLVSVFMFTYVKVCWLLPGWVGVGILEVVVVVCPVAVFLGVVVVVDWDGEVGLVKVSFVVDEGFVDCCVVEDEGCSIVVGSIYLWTKLQFIVETSNFIPAFFVICAVTLHSPFSPLDESNSNISVSPPVQRS